MYSVQSCLYSPQARSNFNDFSQLKKGGGPRKTQKKQIVYGQNYLTFYKQNVTQNQTENPNFGSKTPKSQYLTSPRGVLNPKSLKTVSGKPSLNINMGISTHFAYSHKRMQSATLYGKKNINLSNT